jgi:hypothetical protein
MMRSAFTCAAAGLLFLMVCPVRSPAAGNPGEAGALFLRIGMGARAAGMGEAHIAVAEDASSAFWNPGAMAAVLGTNVMLMHNEYMQSVRLEQMTLTHETDYGTLGLGFSGLYMDELDRYEDIPSASPLGTFPVYDVAVSVGFSRYIFPDVAVGASVKPLYQKIDDQSARGFAFDIGIFHVSRIPGLKLAAVVANLGAPMKFVSEEYALPREIKIGGSYERDIPAARGSMLLALDVLFPNDGDVKEHIGVEYNYTKRLFLRAGFKSGYESYGATFGMGVAYRSLCLDYGLMLVRNDLGDSHRFSLGFRL